MTRSIMALGLAAALVGPAAAQEKKDAAQLPRGPSPLFQVVTGIEPGTGHLVLTRMMTVTTQIPITAEQIVNGQRVTVTRMQPVTQSQLMTVKYSLDKSAVYTADGKKLPADEARKRLTPGTVFLESTNGEPVDPLFLRAVRPETLVLVSPQPPAPPVVPVAVPGTAPK